MSGATLKIHSGVTVKENDEQGVGRLLSGQTFNALGHLCYIQRNVWSELRMYVDSWLVVNGCTLAQIRRLERGSFGEEV